MSVLKPEGSVMAGIATAAFVYGTYQAFLPSIADARSAEPHNGDLASAERGASFATAGVVAAVSLIAKDPTIFILGGGMVIAMAWYHRHANMVIPELGRAVPLIKRADDGQDAGDVAMEQGNDYAGGDISYEASA